MAELETVCEHYAKLRLLEDRLKRYEAALEAISVLEYVYLQDWDATVNAGIQDARDIANLALEKGTEREGSDT